MIASLLTDETLTLENVPRLADVALLVRILGNHGVDYTLKGKRPGEEIQSGQTMNLAPSTPSTRPRPTISCRGCARFWMIAPLLARMGECKVSLPGGCAIGTRPVDLLLMVLERLGATIAIEGGHAIARAPRASAEPADPKTDRPRRIAQCHPSWLPGCHGANRDSGRPRSGYARLSGM